MCVGGVAQCHEWSIFAFALGRHSMHREQGAFLKCTMD